MDEDLTDVISKTEDDGYETQLLGFTPMSFSNGIYNAFNQYMSDGLSAMKQIILTEHGDVISDDEVNKGMSKIQQKIEAKFDDAFDHFESFLTNNLMNIPTNVVLPEDKVQHETVCPEDRDLDKQIQDLKQRITAAQFANVSLAQELELADKSQEELDKIVNTLEENNSILSNITELKEKAGDSLKEMERYVQLIT